MKIGMLGGTFNPIHCAHLQMAMLARDTLALDLVLLMVAADPPHKDVDGHVPASERLKMAQLAAADIPRVEACDMEIRRAGKSYTADTLCSLRERYPGAELYLILGSDMLLDFPAWSRPEQIAAMASIACVPRQGCNEQDAAAAKVLTDAYNARIFMLPAAVRQLSSTEIRDRLEEALPVTGLLPDKVETYCYVSGLYFPRYIRVLQARCKEALTEKRFLHTMGCVQAALTLAAEWDADPLKARLAALLHDCAKYLPPVTLAVYSGDDTAITPVQHAFAGAVLAHMQYGVTDGDVLRAIRLHSTGDGDMTTLDAVVCYADLIEPGRDFPGVDDLRKLAEEGETAAMTAALQRSRVYVFSSGGAFHPASERALWYYKNRKGNVSIMPHKNSSAGGRSH